MSSEDLEQVVVERDDEDEDDFEELQWLDDKVVFDTNRLLVRVSEVGNLKLVKWLYARLMRQDVTASSSSLEQAVDAACSKNQLEVVKFLAARGHAPSSLDVALNGPHTDIVVCLVEQFGKTLRYSQTAIHKATANNERLCMLLHDQLGVEYKWSDFRNWGNMTILTALLDRPDSPMDYCIALQYAVLHNHLEATKFLYAHIKSNATWMNSTQVRKEFKTIMRQIGMGCGTFGDAHEFFVNSEEPGNKDFRLCLRVAIQRKQLWVVGFLHEKRVEGFTADTMDCAAKSGSLAILLFLHEHRSEGCFEFAMNHAVERGFLHVVKFLYANYRDKCCLSYVLTGIAASMGHVRVLEFLFQIGIRVISSRKGLYYTTQNGHLHVIQFMFEHFEELDVSVAMEQACVHGHLEIVKWLVEHQFVQDSTQALEIAKECEQEMVVAWLEQRVAAKRRRLSH